MEAGALPTVLIGDLDSLPAPIVQQLAASGTVVQRFPAAKDWTDMELAVDLALKSGATKIHILGGLGGRFDHTLGNIGLLLKALEHGVEAHLLDPGHDIMLIKDKVSLKKRPGWALSLVPLSLKVSGVTTSGLVFPLNNEDLYIYNTRGIHNEFTQDNALIEINQGILMIIRFQED